MNFIRLAYLFVLLAMVSLWYAPDDPSPTDYFAISAIACVLVSLRFYQQSLRAFYLWVYLFLLANLISMFAVKVPSHAISNLTTLIFLFATLIVYPTIASKFDQKHVSKIYTAIAIAGTISGILGVLAHNGLLPGPTITYYSSDDGLRLSPFFQDPNVYSPFLCFCFALVMTMLWEKKKIPIASAMALPILLGILLSYSRAGWLNLLITGVTFLGLVILIQKDKIMQRRFALLGFAAVSIAVISFPIMIEYLGVAEMLEIRMKIQSYDTERFAAQDLALAISADRPLGVGPGHYMGRAYFPESEFTLDAHNLYLKILVERGWIGLFSFLGIIGYCYRIGYLSIKNNPVRARYSIALMSAMTGILVNSFFISSLHWRHFYIVIGLLLAEHVISERKRKNAKIRFFNTLEKLEMPTKTQS